jgi:hypothetical protein
MGVVCQVFVDLSYQGRLRKADELVGAEIFLFTRLLEEQGTALLNTPGYCLTVKSSEWKDGDRNPILLKVKGVWSSLWLEVRAPDVFVLYDR